MPEAVVDEHGQDYQTMRRDDDFEHRAEGKGPREGDFFVVAAFQIPL